MSDAAFEQWWATARSDGGPLEGSVSLARLAWRAATERAAQVCDEAGAKWWAEYKTGTGPGRANDHTQGRADAADALAAAIRGEG